MSGMPDTGIAALIVIGMTSIIVLGDGWKLIQAHRDIPKFGRFENGAMAWKSQLGQEVVRNFVMVGTVIVMMVVPWLLAEKSDTHIAWVIAFDILLALHAISLIIPKRYAITKDALWVDGFRIEWTRLWWSGWRGGSSIILQRKGWWRLAPLPLGGSDKDIAAAALRIDAIMVSEWETLVELLSEEE
ncbi:MAG: hypothetical protein QF440_05055 [Candidatus Thalassarchaeaceae archaeon]|jgi:hypothetical protein|nr:hypothetical protein [Candidatus Thalassarchaeaceae archaeon]